MSPRATLTMTGAATFVVLAAAAYAVAIGDTGLFIAVAACGFAVAAGWVIVRHEPTSPVGPALAWTTASIALISAHVGPLAELPWSSGAWPLLNLAGLLALMLVFPDGPSGNRMWRLVPLAFAAATVGMMTVQWGAQQVDGRLVGGTDAPWVPPVAITSIVTIGVCMILGAASLAVRYRAGERRTRRRIRWLLLASLIVVFLLVGGLDREFYLDAHSTRRTRPSSLPSSCSCPPRSAWRWCATTCSTSTAS